MKWFVILETRCENARFFGIWEHVPNLKILIGPTTGQSQRWEGCVDIHTLHNEKSESQADTIPDTSRLSETEGSTLCLVRAEEEVGIREPCQ